MPSGGSFYGARFQESTPRGHPAPRLLRSRGIPEIRKPASLSPSEHNVPARTLSAAARASRPTEPSARFLETSENSPCWYASCFLPDRQLRDCRKQRGLNYDKEEDAMRRDLRRTFLMPALLALLAFVAAPLLGADRKSTRLNSSHGYISYAVFCLKKKRWPAGRSVTIWLA